ncbi:MAG: transferrin receptor-like dimerization domain-containing protein [Bryobacteraceae bacterium]
MRSNTISLLIFVLAGSLCAQQAEQQALLGFTAQSTKDESQWEDRFRALPDPRLMRASMQLLSARPHHVGSPYDRQNAEWILTQYKQWGWDAHIETFQVLFPTPKTRLLEMVAPTRFVAKLDEPALSIDPTSSQKNEQLPTYNAYSPDGDVTAPLVYVNYGLVEDYEQLALRGVSVKGAIVIARYGHSWRGIKPKVAAEHGALGCILYSDPADDGYSHASVFPKGPMRPSEGVQRGSVLDAPLYPGDPLTPNIGATSNAKRLKREDAPSLARVPVLPISYADAQPLLAALDGPVAPAAWRGGLPITYRLGPGAAKVHLKLAFNWDLKPVYDVVATMRGAEEPDIWILRANHHDAWVNGAGDPVSGQVALLEEARALGQLSKQGWKPKRTIMYFSWDGEEPMLLGSTEYAEEHADELREHAAAYVNSDGNQRGYLSVAGSHSLESLVNEVARSIDDPESKVSVWKRLQAQLIVQGSPQQRKEARNRPNLRIGALGSGSDYSPFLDHLGVASLDLSYAGEDDSAGVYHSIYDDFYWYTHFSDTDFAYGRALARTAGTMVMRLADADILPYDFSSLSDTVHQYSDEVKALLKARQDEALERQSDIERNVYRVTSDPKHPTVAPSALETPPYLNFAPLDNALALLDTAAAHYNTARAKAEVGLLSRDQLKTINEQLAQAERKLTSPQGLPRRPWMRHLLYAPGWYTGYDPKTLPGVREAIEQRRYPEAEMQIALVAQALTDEAAYIEQLAKELHGPAPLG